MAEEQYIPISDPGQISGIVSDMITAQLKGGVVYSDGGCEITWTDDVKIDLTGDTKKFYPRLRTNGGIPSIPSDWDDLKIGLVYYNYHPTETHGGYSPGVNKRTDWCYSMARGSNKLTPHTIDGTNWNVTSADGSVNYMKINDSYTWVGIRCAYTRSKNGGESDTSRNHAEDFGGPWALSPTIKKISIENNGNANVSEHEDRFVVKAVVDNKVTQSIFYDIREHSSDLWTNVRFNQYKITNAALAYKSDEKTIKFTIDAPSLSGSGVDGKKYDILLYAANDAFGGTKAKEIKGVRTRHKPPAIQLTIEDPRATGVGNLNVKPSKTRYIGIKVESIKEDEMSSEKDLGKIKYRVRPSGVAWSEIDNNTNFDFSEVNYGWRSFNPLSVQNKVGFETVSVKGATDWYTNTTGLATDYDGKEYHVQVKAESTALCDSRWSSAVGEWASTLKRAWATSMGNLTIGDSQFQFNITAPTSVSGDTNSESMIGAGYKGQDKIDIKLRLRDHNKPVPSGTPILDDSYYSELKTYEDVFRNIGGILTGGGNNGITELDCTVAGGRATLYFTDEMYREAYLKFIKKITKPGVAGTNYDQIDMIVDIITTITKVDGTDGPKLVKSYGKKLILKGNIQCARVKKSSAMAKAKVFYISKDGSTKKVSKSVVWSSKTSEIRLRGIITN